MKIIVPAIATFLLCFCHSSICAQNLDYELMKSLSQNDNKTVNNVFRDISNLDKYFIVVAPAALLCHGLVNHDKKFKMAGVQATIALCVSTVISSSLKSTIKRTRPFEAHPDIIKRSDGGGYSFPSGHTSSAFAIATSLSLSFPKWYVVAPAYAYASLVGVSRVKLGVHYPTDVLCGAFIGTASAFAANYLNKRLFGKQHLRRPHM